MNTFDDIFDQPDAIDWLTRAWETGRLPHGLIFAGPTGVGKATTARVLAALFLCEKSMGVRPCGTCQSCRLLAAGTHPDYTLVYRQLIRLEKEDSKAKEIAISLVRQYVLEPASHKPMLGRGRVFVIEEADLMNTAAQNSLLKTLEEPLGRTLILLLTDSPDALLQTIRSRCQIVRFSSLSPQTVTRELAHRGIDAATASAAAEMSEGSLGLAIQWIEDGVVARGRELDQQVNLLIAGEAAPDLAGWLTKAADDYVKAQTTRDEKVSADQAKREGITLYLRLAARRFRDVLKQSPDSGQLERACDAIESIAAATSAIDGNVNLSLILQHVTLTLSRQATGIG